jgi:hypothetical protein
MLVCGLSGGVHPRNSTLGGRNLLKRVVSL